MKVVLFCGGQGTRLRDYSETVPKPMVPIGYRPILWHVMRYYAHFGHKDFILCLGYRADVIKQYFLQYDETVSNDFVMAQGGRKIDVLRRDIDDWRITFVDTGIGSCVGERLKAVESYLDGEETFLANYSDGLTDFPLPALVERHLERNSIATLLCVRPSQTFHVVCFGGQDGLVTDIEDSRRAGFWVNGGFFVFNRRIFDYLHEGEDLVHEPFQRLMREEKLSACRHEGFWACMDTFRDKQVLDDMVAHGKLPWAVWKKPEPPSVVAAA